MRVQGFEASRVMSVQGLGLQSQGLASGFQPVGRTQLCTACLCRGAFTRPRCVACFVFAAASHFEPDFSVAAASAAVQSS